MAEADYVIANDTAAAVRADINNTLAAIVSNNSKATEPTTMYAFQWWYDTSTNVLKLRNAANSAWINVGSFNQSTNTFTPSINNISFQTGDLLIHNGTQFLRVGIGAVGQRLTVNSAGNAPEWQTENLQLIASGRFDPVGTIAWSYGISSVSWVGTGIAEITFATPRASANYVVHCMHLGTGPTDYAFDSNSPPSTTKFRIRTWNHTTLQNLNTLFSVLEYA